MYMAFDHTGHSDDLITILAIFKNDPKSRSVNNSLQRPDLDPYSFFVPARATPSQESQEGGVGMWGEGDE